MNVQTHTTLTEDQQKAADAFMDFLQSASKTFVLSGGAGVGKSYILGHMSNSIMKDYENVCAMLGVEPGLHSVLFTATTNKAARVLEQAIGASVTTVHKALCLNVHTDFRTGKQTIKKTNAWKPLHNVLLIIDESSMIDQALYDIIMETLVDSKVVFVGDASQMSPVNEDVSAVYLDVDQDNFIHLGKPVRNAGTPALVELCAQLRETVNTGIFKPIKGVPGVIDYLSMDEMERTMEQVFANNLTPSARILAFTNNRVNDYNEVVRDMRGLPTDFQVGDKLVVASNYCSGASSMSVELDVTVINVDSTIQAVGYSSYSPDGNPVTAYTITVKRHDGLQNIVMIANNPAHYKATLEAIKRKKSWLDYYTLKEGIADLRDHAACTVYKSQGSTYDEVFIDLGNIGTSFDSKQVARMLFVAASRARSRIYLFGQLPGKYSGG